MKPEELRIGNWVMYSSPIQVNANKILECEQHPDRFGPIYLTEGWLIKFGFEWEDIVTKTTGETEKMLCKGLLMMQRHHDNMWAACPYGYPLNPHQSIYVHQLQNLYYALTGTELEIKDPVGDAKA